MTTQPVDGRLQDRVVVCAETGPINGDWLVREQWTSIGLPRPICSKIGRQVDRGFITQLLIVVGRRHPKGGIAKTSRAGVATEGQRGQFPGTRGQLTGQHGHWWIRALKTIRLVHLRGEPLPALNPRPSSAIAPDQLFPGATNPRSSPSPTIGPTAASIGQRLPPTLERRSITQPAVGV